MNLIPIPQLADRYAADREGNVYRLYPTKPPRKLKPRRCPRGYLHLGLRNTRSAPGTHYRVHRLIAATFIPTDDPSLDINHINGDKADNRVENLEWVTRQQNVQHAIDTELRAAGAYGHAPKPVEGTPVAGGDPIQFGSARAAARFFGINHSRITQVCRGERKSCAGYRWAYLSE
jgi:hypothetical protein